MIPQIFGRFELVEFKITRAGAAPPFRENLLRRSVQEESVRI
jgi:hypothetical protein